MNTTEYKREWQRRNKEKVTAYSRKYRQLHSARHQAAVNNWRQRNPSKVRSMSNRAGKKWSASNKARKNLHTSIRRAALRRATGPWTDKDAIYELYVIAEKLSSATGEPHEVDHIIPLQGAIICGLHCSWNLQVIPRTLNRSKGSQCVF